MLIRVFLTTSLILGLLTQEISAGGSNKNNKGSGSDKNSGVSCAWGDWEDWSSCSATCGHGTRVRMRSAEKDSTAPCSGQDREEEDCDAGACAAGCTDDAAWVDRHGQGCAAYVSDKWCDISSEDGYGSGWVASWGKFTDLANAAGEDATTACCACACASDVLMLVDRSGSIGTANWKLLEQFMEDRVAKTTFSGARGNHIGIAGFSTKPELLCDLSSDSAYLLKCIKGIKYTGGWTNMDIAITLASGYLQTASPAYRRRVLEVLTDGESTNDKKKTQAAARAAKDEGLIVVALGVGTGTNEKELEDLASEPKADHWTNIRSWDRLINAAAVLAAGCVPRIPNGATTDWDLTEPLQLQLSLPRLTDIVGGTDTTVDPIIFPTVDGDTFVTEAVNGTGCAANIEAAIGWRFPETTSGSGTGMDCGLEFVRVLLEPYGCVQPDMTCNVLYCSLPLPHEILLELARCAPDADTPAFP